MARSRTELQTLLEAIPGPLAVYFQPPGGMEFPCIRYERDNSWISRADNRVYLFLKRYQVTVIDRDPDSAIPDLVEQLDHCRFDRFYKTEGLNHWVYNLYF